MKEVLRSKRVFQLLKLLPQPNYQMLSVRLAAPCFSWNPAVLKDGMTVHSFSNEHTSLSRS